MSYDLYFLRPEARPPIATSEVFDYFKGRPHYQVNQAAGQAFYANKKTGVYFNFELTTRGEFDPEEAPDERDGLVDSGVSFNLNYCRPHVFGLEAEPEVTAFVEHFDLLVDDPQNEGMGRGRYSPEGFLQGWNAGNLFGYFALQAQGQAKNVLTLPSELIHRVWQWNYRVRALQRQFGDDVFVPSIMFAKQNGVAVPFVTWTDAIPTVLPEVPFIVFVRMELAKRRLFGLLPGKVELMAAPWATLSPVLDLATRIGDPKTNGYHQFTATASQEALESFFRGLPMAAPALESVGMDDILDAELFAQAAQPRA